MGSNINLIWALLIRVQVEVSNPWWAEPGNRLWAIVFNIDAVSDFTIRGLTRCPRQSVQRTVQYQQSHQKLERLHLAQLVSACSSWLEVSAMIDEEYPYIYFLD